MKQILQALAILLFIPFNSYSQIKVKEFEGIIKYKHEVIAKNSSYNVEYDYSGIGRNSDYYYKKGNYKFVNHNAYFKADLFKSKDFKNYLLMSNSDTVLCLDSRVTDIEVLEFGIKDSVETILDYSCNVMTLKLKPIGKDYPISYRRYYYSEKLPVNPDHFKGCKGAAYELIYENTKSLPLKIEFEWPNKIIIWEAIEVIEKKLSKDVFKLDKNLFLEKMN